MNLKACAFERLAFISSGFGEFKGAQVGKTSLVEMNLLRRKRRHWAYSFFHLVRFRPWDPTKTFDLWKKTAHFFTMRSEDSEMTPPRQRAGVLSQQRLRPRRLTTPSNVYCT